MEFIEFTKERKRMCDSCTDCHDCPLYELYDQDAICLTWCANNPLKAQEIVQKWAEENPIRTRKSIFLEKFPKAILNELGVPCTCVQSIFGEDIKCVQIDEHDCVRCWNTPIE